MLHTLHVHAPFTGRIRHKEKWDQSLYGGPWCSPFLRNRVNVQHRGWVDPPLTPVTQPLQRPSGDEARPKSGFWMMADPQSVVATQKRRAGFPRHEVTFPAGRASGLQGTDRGASAVSKAGAHPKARAEAGHKLHPSLKSHTSSHASVFTALLNKALLPQTSGKSDVPSGQAVQAAKAWTPACPAPAHRAAQRKPRALCTAR